ncbi:MAG TPA: ribonucleoside-diphosphate reductase subunit alpha, partial [Solirubrobacteraceae bacterium]|nr:ribonucleoside-diphosphate reductase subunit alpha [Solirubrobacteraceae bacterium]
GDFVVVNPFLVRDLKAAGLWSETLAGELKAQDGDLTEILGIPAELKARYRTAFQIPGEALIDAAARRQKWIDQSQSLNLFLPAPDMKAMSHLYRRAWRAGLKTTYYLRTFGASTIEKATVTVSAAPGVPVGAEPSLAGPAVSAAAIACSLEAARTGEECEACQ